MGADHPAWYYVDGQLRYKDGAGWTDQYQSIDRASESKVLRTAEPEVFRPTTRAEARKQGTSRNRHKSRPTPQTPPDGLPASTQPGQSRAQKRVRPSARPSFAGSARWYLSSAA